MKRKFCFQLSNHHMFKGLKTIPIVYINKFQILGKIAIAIKFVKYQRLVSDNCTQSMFIHHKVVGTIGIFVI